MTAGSGVREGDILADKYRIEKIIGQGAMGIVVAARHLKLDERVAIKFLSPEALSHPDAVVRFEREARAAVKIKSEHVARVGDVGTLESGAPFMVMEYLEGGDLADWLEKRGPLSIEQAIEFVLQALEAIAEAHALGIIHRDLKPANLFCIRRADGLLSIKVLDFGISKIGGAAATEADLSMTKTSDAMGTPLYMSPEQMHSARDVDATTDIWSVGVILFELLTGTPPYVASNLPELVLKVANTAPARLRSVRPDAPARLEQVILRCLEKDRRKRYRNVAELAAALEEFGPPRARASTERIARIMQASELSESAPPTSRREALETSEEAVGSEEQLWRERATTRRGVGVALAAAAIVAAALTALYSTSQAPEEGDPAALSATGSSAVPSLPVRAVETPAREAVEIAPTPSAAPVLSPAPAAGSAAEPTEKPFQPPVKKPPTTPNTIGSPTRSTNTPSSPAAFSSAQPGKIPRSQQSPAPPRTGAAYDSRK